MTVREFSPDLVLLEMSPRKHCRRFLAKRCSSATLPCKGRVARAFARAGWGEPKRCISERVRASIAGRSEGDQVEVSHEPVARGAPHPGARSAPTLPLQGRVGARGSGIGHFTGLRSFRLPIWVSIVRSIASMDALG